MNREIDENGYVIIEPIIKIDIDKKEDLKKSITGCIIGNITGRF